MNGREFTGTAVVPVKDTAPTLAELGIDKKTSARAQRLAALSDEAFEAVRSGDVKPTEALRRARNVEKIAAARALPAVRSLAVTPLLQLPEVGGR